MESYYYVHVIIGHRFKTVLNGNFVSCVLNGSSSIVQHQFFEIRQIFGIMQGCFSMNRKTSEQILEVVIN